MSEDNFDYSWYADVVNNANKTYRELKYFMQTNNISDVSRKRLEEHLDSISEGLSDFFVACGEVNRKFQDYCVFNDINSPGAKRDRNLELLMSFYQETYNGLNDAANILRKAIAMKEKQEGLQK